MLRYTRFLTTFLFVVLVAHVLVPGAVAQTPSPTSTPTPSPEPSGSATATPTPTPTPTSSGTPTPTPSGTSTPEPEPTSTPSPGQAELVVTSTADRVFAQLGGWIDYTVVVRNVGSAPAENVTVSTNVADELTVIGVPILDDLAQQNLISVGDREQIIWVIESLPAGKQRRLPWVGQAVSRGDLVAENLNAAWTDETDSVATARTYLGGSTTPTVASNGEPPAPRRTITRRIVRYEPRAVTEAAPGQILPYTGAEVSPLAVLGLLAILVGILLWALSRSPRSRLRVLGLALAVLVAGCIGADEPVDDLTPGAASGITSASSDRVLGTRIDRDQPSEDPTPDGASDEAPEEADDATDPAVVDDEPDTTAVPGEDALVPVVTTVTVPVEGEREVVAAEAGLGDNLLSFDWDEASRSILSASSSRMIRSDAVTSLLAEQVITPGSVTTRVVLTNDTDDRDVRVTGRLVIEIEGALATGARLQSLPIDETLAPGESVSAEFVYALPSGSYSVVPSFEV